MMLWCGYRYKHLCLPFFCHCFTRSNAKVYHLFGDSARLVILEVLLMVCYPIKCKECTVTNCYKIITFILSIFRKSVHCTLAFVFLIFKAAVFKKVCFTIASTCAKCYLLYLHYVPYRTLGNLLGVICHQ